MYGKKPASTSEAGFLVRASAHRRPDFYETTIFCQKACTVAGNVVSLQKEFTFGTSMLFSAYKEKEPQK